MTPVHFSKRAVVVLLFFICAAVHGREIPAIGIPLRIWATGTVSYDPEDEGASGALSVSVDGVLAPYDPGSGVPPSEMLAFSETVATSPGQVTTGLGNGGVVFVEFNRSYTLNIGGTNLGAGDVVLACPPGFQVVLGGLRRSKTTFSNSLSMEFEIVPAARQQPALSGTATTVAVSEIQWSVSLGRLQNGESAGDLELIDTGTRTDWTPLFSSGRLYYESTSSEVSVVRNYGVIRQIIANEVAIDINQPSPPANWYEVRCYNPAQRHPVTGIFSGSPFATYKVEQNPESGAPATSIRITKELREDLGNPSAPVVRRERMSITRTGSWPTFDWTRRDWTLDGQSPLTEVFVDGSGTTGSRVETIYVREPGGATAKTITRQYTSSSQLGEIFASETVGTGATAITSQFTTSTAVGSFGYVTDVSITGGNSLGFGYYDATTTTSSRIGKISHRYRPFLGQTEVTNYTFTTDLFGAETRPSGYTTKIGEIVVGQSAITYNDSWGTSNGVGLVQKTEVENGLTTITRSYRDDEVWKSWLRSRVYSLTMPEGLKKSFYYTPSVGSSTTAVITGASTGEGSPLSSYNSSAIDPVYVIDGKSTLEVTLRDERALVTRTELHYWKSGLWNLTGFTNYSYDALGRLVAKSGPSGVTYSATYTNGIKTSETDEMGVVTTFNYDVHGRVSTKTRLASGTIAALTTKYTYNAAGDITKEEVGYNQSGTIITTYTFDDAGRVTTETPPGNYGVSTHAYNPGARTHTITRADGSTLITTNYADGRLYSKAGTGVVAEYHTYGVETDGQRWHQTDIGTASSARWSKNWVNGRDQPVREERPGYTSQPNVVTEYVYGGTTGQLTKINKTGYAATLYQYGPLGQLSRSGTDIDGSNALELSGTDRITDIETNVEYLDGGWWLRTDTSIYPKLGLGIAVVTSTSRTRLSGHSASLLSETRTRDAEGNEERVRLEVNRNARTAVKTTSRSGWAGVQTESFDNGLPKITVNFDGRTTTQNYDGLLRPSTVTDPRGNVTTTGYISGTKLVQLVKNQANNETVMSYDTMGRVIALRDPKNYYTRTSYTLKSQVHRQWGDGTMPVEFGYDATYGDRITMSTYRGGTGWDGTNWPGSPGTADTTTWSYHSATGLLTAKTDSLGRSATQTYNSRGQTAVRTLARGATATYSYDSATGELLTQTYSDSTPAVTFTYGRTGQVETVADFTGTRDFVYDSSKPWRLSAEAESDFYGSRVVTRLYDETNVYGRPRGFQIGAGVGSKSDLEQTYNTTIVGRVDSVTSNRLNNTAGSRTFRYGFLANTAIIQSLSVDGSHPFTINRSFESQRDLVTDIESKWSTTSRSKFTYTYDERALRSKVVQAGNVFSDYGDVTSQQFVYNGRGELTGAVGYIGSDITNATKQLPGRRHEFDYDSAGNRKWSNRTGVTAMRDDYEANALNQYTTRENNTVPVSGTAAADAVVTVQGGTLAPILAGRQGRYWNDEFTVNNNANPLDPNPWRGPLTFFTAKVGTGGAADVYKVESRMVEIAARLQTFTYDLDGNLTSDGVVDYQWDAENRLVKMETTVLARTWGFPHREITFRYDYLNRRVQKRVVDVTAGQEISCRRYLYEGWNVVAEYNAPGAGTLGTLVRSYTWGLDIVSSLGDSGGVGALLQIADHPTAKTYLPSYDGNGNVVALFDAANGNLAAAYEYSPYGESLRTQTFDSTIADNPFRFSTKWTDGETGLVYYGRRYYSSSQGRFLGRDPIEEAGGLNLYRFCQNNSVNAWDRLGCDAVVLPTVHVTASKFPDYDDVVTGGMPGGTEDAGTSDAGDNGSGDGVVAKGPLDTSGQVVLDMIQQYINDKFSKEIKQLKDLLKDMTPQQIQEVAGGKDIRLGGANFDWNRTVTVSISNVLLGIPITTTDIAVSGSLNVNVSFTISTSETGYSVNLGGTVSGSAQISTGISVLGVGPLLSVTNTTKLDNAQLPGYSWSGGGGGG